MGIGCRKSKLAYSRFRALLYVSLSVYEKHRGFAFSLTFSVADPVMFWYESWLWIRTPGGSGSASGSCFFRHWLAKKNSKFFFAYHCLKVHFNLSSKIKSHKEVKKGRNQGFSFYFCLMMEGSESGSWRSKNLWGSGSTTLCFTLSMFVVSPYFS